MVGHEHTVSVDGHDRLPTRLGRLLTTVRLVRYGQRCGVLHAPIRTTHQGTVITQPSGGERMAAAEETTYGYEQQHGIAVERERDTAV